ncbi:hypothetical protein SAMD00024442_15_8 [Candidatus Symbiothrix dinenymphae]|nr:hypothetical protein SAMD00024442_15_8 [Candidatus Symbiothrix dinenymphae]
MQTLQTLRHHMAFSWGGGARSLRASRRKISLFLSGIFVSVLFALSYGCKEETYEFTQGQVGGDPHNPALPVTVTGFTPDSGRIREKVLISGSNFGNDASQVEVLFNDGFADRKANVLSVNGTAIYCLAPKQSSGSNQIKVSIAGGSAVAASKTFGYKAVETVSWFAGAGNANGNYDHNSANAALDGPLASATFFKPQGIVALGGGQVMTFGFHQGAAARTRFISGPDNQVVTLQYNAYMGKPAVNEDKTIVYNTTLNPPYPVYQYPKVAGWTPENIGVITVPSQVSTVDNIRTLVMMDKAHDPAQEWLYFCHRDQIFGRYNVNTNVTEEISTGIAGLPTSGWGPYMVYDRFKDCFYVSYFQRFSIYKITKTGANWGDGVLAVLYAGNTTDGRVVDGALTDALFFQPKGMCMDDEGNLYICESNFTAEDSWTSIAGQGDVIRKISGIDGQVTTVAGKLGVEGPAPRPRGEPLQSVLLDPQDISYDGEGNLYISEWWECQIVIYSIE